MAKSKLDLKSIDDVSFNHQGLVLPNNDQTWVHNFASSSAGATFVESPKDTGGMSNNFLTGAKDKYLIAPWNSKKEYVISLSEEIVIEKFMLLNTEEFSSRIELFNLYGSSKYPTDNWEKLGSFMANDVMNQWQSFRVDKTWIRYLKFSWKTSHGFQYYCTLTQIKVCGQTMAQGLKDELESIHIDKPQPIINLNSHTYANDSVNSGIFTNARDSLSSNYSGFGDVLEVYKNDDTVQNEYAIDFNEMWLVESIVLYLKEQWSLDVQQEYSKENKLVSVFQILDQKLKILNLKVSSLELINESLNSRIVDLELYYKQVEHLNENLKNEIKTVKAKISTQDYKIENLTQISYVIWGLLVILIIIILLYLWCSSNYKYLTEIEHINDQKHVSSSNTINEVKEDNETDENVLVNRYESDNGNHHQSRFDYVVIGEDKKGKKRKKNKRKHKRFNRL